MLEGLTKRVYENCQQGLARQILQIGIAETQEAFDNMRYKGFDLTMEFKCDVHEVRDYFLGILAKIKAENLTWIKFNKKNTLFKSSEKFKIRVDDNNKA